jgi:hypothetical protein
MKRRSVAGVRHPPSPTLRPEGLEPPTIGSEDRCSVQLSYGRLRSHTYRMARAPSNQNRMGTAGGCTTPFCGAWEPEKGLPGAKPNGFRMTMALGPPRNVVTPPGNAGQPPVAQ